MRLFKRPHCVKQTTYCIALTLLFLNHHEERDFLRIISYAPVYSCTSVVTGPHPYLAQSLSRLQTAFSASGMLIASCDALYCNTNWMQFSQL